MSKRARAFVDYWTSEFLQPDSYEDEESLPESQTNAAACVAAAAAEGIRKPEIEEEFADLVAHFAQLHERMVDRALTRFVLRRTQG